MAIAMLWMVTLGGEQEFTDDETLLSDRSSTSFPAPTPTLSCFLNGLLTVIAQLTRPICEARIPLGTDCLARPHCLTFSFSD